MTIQIRRWLTSFRCPYVGAFASIGPLPNGIGRLTITGACLQPGDPKYENKICYQTFVWSRVALVSSNQLFGNLLDVTLVFDDSELNYVALVVLQTPLAIIQPEDPMCEKCFLENVQKLLLTFLVCGWFTLFGGNISMGFLFALLLMISACTVCGIYPAPCLFLLPMNRIIPLPLFICSSVGLITHELFHTLGFPHMQVGHPDFLQNSTKSPKYPTFNNSSELW